MKKKLLIIALVLLTATVLVAQPAAEKKYATLQIYAALDTEEAQYYIEAFEKSTGIKVEFVRMSSGEVGARIEAEKNNPQASVWFGGSNTDHINVHAKGLLMPYKPKTDFELAPMLHADDYGWNGFYTGAIGFVTNTEFLKKNNIEAPQSWADLLKPEFHGQIEMAYPYTSGTGYTAWATIIQDKGLEKALDWWELLDKNIHQYTASGTACIARAGLGECAVGIAFSHDIIAKGIGMGYPLVMSFPSEGTGFEVGGVSMIKGARQVEEAQIFIDWCFSEEAQNLFKKYSRLPVNPKATVAEGAIKLSDINLIDYDAVQMGQRKDEFVTAWRDRIGK